MTPTSSSLLALAERVEGLDGPDREVDCRIWAALNGGGFDTYAAVVPDFGQWRALYYTASLDAAMTLVPEGLRASMTFTGLDGYSCDISDQRGRQIAVAYSHRDPERPKMPIPSLALCAAALRARAQSGEQA